jgi:site-specific DNA recombinase
MIQPMKTASFFIYARKSTKGDDKQALSIESQLEALDQLVAQQNLTVVDMIIERESAHVPGRPRFNAMLRRIEAGEATGIIAWHPDRLARNSRDGGEIIYLLDTGALTQLKFCTFWFENTPQGKSNLGHEFVQTKQYSDKLACDTKRGLMQKAKNGIYPSKAPRGYLNNRLTKTLVLDPQLAPIVKRAFEVYAEGASTIEDMKRFFAARGMLSKPTKRWQSQGGKHVHIEWVRRFLRNPIYYGHFEYGGVRYEGKHEPIISKELFDRVQEVLEGRTHHMKPEPQQKPFGGLFRCAECGMMVTAEVQKGHTYYRCSKKSKALKCSQPFIREEELERQLGAMLTTFSLRSDWADEMLTLLEAERKESAQSVRAILKQKREEIAAIANKVQKLLDTYLEELIDREIFAERKAALMAHKKGLEEQVAACEQDRNAWLEPFRRWIVTAKTTGEVAVTGAQHEKKALAQKVFGSNLFLDSKKARGSASKPWSLLLETEFSGGMVPRLGLEPRTN